MFRPNVKEFIIWEQIKSLLGVARLTDIYIKMSWFITKPCNIMAPGRKETRALFPHLSPPLYISHSLSLLTVSHPLSLSLSITSLFPNGSFSVWLSCGTPDLHPVSGTRQVRAYPVPTCRHIFQIRYNKAAWSQVSGRRPEEVLLFDSNEFLRGGTNKREQTISSF